MSFTNWVFQTLASEDIIDLYFVKSDLVEVSLTEADIVESAYYSSVATAIANKQVVVKDRTAYVYSDEAWSALRDIGGAVGSIAGAIFGVVGWLALIVFILFGLVVFYNFFTM
jgi:hypothetical protein